MEEVVKLVNQLQDVFAAVGGRSSLSLPQIAVVGSQSSGKSSVLESIVGRDFLPRGRDIVTRAPLVLQLEPLGADRQKEYGEFLHKPGVFIDDFTEICREIERQTDLIAGAGKCVSDKPIRLRLSMNGVPHLTLVDLPGLAKNPVGDQPEDIEEQITDIIRTYIAPAETLILAVSEATVDIATSDALRMARQVDPRLERTIGVLTKVDLMERGTDVRALLEGKVIPLTFGFIAVVNRSQDDIRRNVSVKDAWEKENNFFQTHPAYSGMQAKLGSRYLARRLSQLLCNHIEKSIPELKERIASRLAELRGALAKCGPPPPQTGNRAAQGAVLLEFLTKYTQAFLEEMTGVSKASSTKDLRGGAQIRQLFVTKFRPAIASAEIELTDKAIRIAMRNAMGPRQSLFVPEGAFAVLVHRGIESFRPICLECVADTERVLLSVLDNLCGETLSRFPELAARVRTASHSLVARAAAPTRHMVTKLIDIELAFLNTSHEDFIGGSGAVEAAVHRLQQRPKEQKSAMRMATTAAKQASSSISDLFFGGSVRSSSAGDPRLSRMPETLALPEEPTDRELQELEIIRVLVESYMAIVRKNVQDSVPKAVMSFLVDELINTMQSELVASLYRDELLDSLLGENTQTSRQRGDMERMVRILRRSLDIVNEHGGTDRLG